MKFQHEDDSDDNKSQDESEKEDSDLDEKKRAEKKYQQMIDERGIKLEEESEIKKDGAVGNFLNMYSESLDKIEQSPASGSSNPSQLKLSPMSIQQPSSSQLALPKEHIHPGNAHLLDHTQQHYNKSLR